MKQLKVNLTAVCNVPDEFQITPENFGNTAVRFMDGSEERPMMIQTCTISLTRTKISVMSPKRMNKSAAAGVRAALRGLENGHRGRKV